MVRQEDILAFAQTLVKEFHPASIWLFGSYAYGEPTKDSDVDFLIVMQTDIHPARQAAFIRLKTRPSFPVDLVVRTPAQIHERLAVGDSFLETIFSCGKPLYES